LILTVSPELTRARATELCSFHDDPVQFPDQFVTVYNLVASDYAERVLAQNAKSQEYFGQLVGNFPEKLIQGNLMSLMATAVSALFTPGTAFHVIMPMARPPNPAVNYNTSLLVDREKGLLVVSGTPVY
jgi:hypothetical protein